MEPVDLEEAIAMAGIAAELRRMAEKVEREIASALPRLRSEAGVTQRDLAKRADISQAYLSQIENGARSVTPVADRLFANLSTNGAQADLARARKRGTSGSS